MEPGQAEGLLVYFLPLRGLDWVVCVGSTYSVLSDLQIIFKA